MDNFGFGLRHFEIGVGWVTLCFAVVSVLLQFRDHFLFGLFAKF